MAKMIELGLSRPDDGEVERKDSRISQGGGLIQLGLNGQPAQWKSVDAGRLMRDGFSVNVTVYRAVMANASAIAGVPWFLVRKPAAGVKGVRPQKIITPTMATKALQSRWGRKAVEYAEIEDHPILTILEQPNPVQCGYDFIEALIAYLLTTGNTYTELVRDTKGRVVQLWLIRPDRMRVVPHPQLVVGGYTFTADDGTKVPFAADAISHMKLFGGFDPYYGLSPLAVAARSVDSDNEALRWAYNLLLNDCRPPGAFVSKGAISDPSFERLKKEIRQKYQGALNSGKPLVLDNGMSWVNFSMTPKEVSYLESRKDWKRDICTAINTPQELVGLGDITYANRKEAKKALYTENVLPTLDRLRDRFNTTVVDSWDPRYYLDYDTDQIEALQEEQTALWARADASRDLTINERRTLKGYPPIAGGDVILISAADQPLGASEGAPGDVIEGQVVIEPPALPAGAGSQAATAAEKAMARLRRIVGELPSGA